MNIKYIAKKHYFLISIVIVVLLSSCGDGKHIYKVESVNKSQEEDTLSIEKINFYLEASVSMKGYVNTGTVGSYPIKDIIPFLITDIDKANNINANLFIITDKEQRYSRSKADFFNELRSGNLLNGKSSNLQTIFKNMISTSNDETINILVSDCIVDLGKGTHTLNEKGLVTNEIYGEIKKRDDIGVAVFKYTSDFNGDYYFDRNNTRPMPYRNTILKSRPFYIWVFGNQNLVAKLLSQNIFKDYIDSHTYNISFSNIESGLLEHPRSGKIAVNASQNTVLFSDVDERRPAKFTVGLKLDQLPPMLKNKLINDENYVITPDFIKNGISLEIKDNSLLNDNIPNKSQIVSSGYTHFIQPTFYDFDNSITEITFDLLNKNPLWITNSNLEDDLGKSIEELESKTFGFDYITNAFERAFNADEPIFQLKLTKLNNK